MNAQDREDIRQEMELARLVNPTRRGHRAWIDAYRKVMRSRRVKEPKSRVETPGPRCRWFWIQTRLGRILMPLREDVCATAVVTDAGCV